MKTGFFETGYSSERAIEAAAHDPRLQAIAAWGALEPSDEDAWRNTGEVAQLDAFFAVGEDHGLTFGQTVQSLEIAISFERQIRGLEGVDG